MSYFLEMTEGMTLEELQVKYAELVEFNADMNQELNAVKDKCAAADHKLDAIRNMLYCNRIFDVDVTFMYPCIAFDIATNNYIFKQCESAPFSFSNYENAWSEEYAIEPIYLDELKRLIESHKIFEEMHGLEKDFTDAIWDMSLERLEQAIADVRSCQPEQDIEQWVDGFRACGGSGWSKYDDPVSKWLKEDRGE